MGSNRARLRALCLAAAGLTVAAGGCSTVTPFGSINTLSTGGQNYLAGRASQVFPASKGFLDQTRGALDDVNVRSIDQRREGDTVVFEGKDAKEHRVVVWVRPESEGAKMRVHARFGAFGDEALSRAFLDRLASRVADLAGEVNPEPAPGQDSPQLKLRSNSADTPPGSIFQRRLEGGVRELPYP